MSQDSRDLKFPWRIFALIQGRRDGGLEVVFDRKKNCGRMRLNLAVSEWVLNNWRRSCDVRINSSSGNPEASVIFGASAQKLDHLKGSEGCENPMNSTQPFKTISLYPLPRCFRGIPREHEVRLCSIMIMPDIPTRVSTCLSPTCFMDGIGIYQRIFLRFLFSLSMFFRVFFTSALERLLSPSLIANLPPILPHFKTSKGIFMQANGQLTKTPSSFSALGLAKPH